MRLDVLDQRWFAALLAVGVVCAASAGVLWRRSPTSVARSSAVLLGTVAAMALTLVALVVFDAAREGHAAVSARTELPQGGAVVLVQRREFPFSASREVSWQPRVGGPWLVFPFGHDRSWSDAFEFVVAGQEIVVREDDEVVALLDLGRRKMSGAGREWGPGSLLQSSDPLLRSPRVHSAAPGWERELQALFAGK